MPAANLADAARRCDLDLTTRYLTDNTNYPASVQAFCNACNAPGVFDNAVPNDHPMINWIASLFNTSAAIVASAGTGDNFDAFQLLQALIQQMYRFCSLGYWMHDITNPKMITDVQAAAVLAAYNANISTS